MAQILECTFNNSNGENTGVWTRTGPAKTYPSPGILYRRNCPDNLHFYCDPTVGQNSYYKLLNPKDYGINSNGNVYVHISTEYLTSWKLVNDNSVIGSGSSSSSSQSGNGSFVSPGSPNMGGGFTSVSADTGIIMGSTGKNISDTITEYISYTGKPQNVLTPKTNFNAYKNVSDNYFMNYSSFSKDIETVEKNLNIAISPNIATAIKTELMQRFNRFLIAFPNTALNKTFAHVFFTRPELNLYNSNGSALLPEVANDPYFYYLDKNDKNLLKSLTRNFSAVHDFNPFLSNKAGSFTLKDEFIKTEEYGETLTGWKIKYGKHNIESKTADDFDIEYTEDSDYSILKLHKAWIDYISKVYRGEFSPTRNSISNRTIDYACSVYFFLCGPDGETLIFWSKYTGVFPTNIPSTAANWSVGDLTKMPKVSIHYEYSWKEDMMPTTLAEFNLNSAKDTNNTYAKIYEPSLGSTGRTFVGTPFVETVENAHTGTYEYKLRFRS